MSPGYINTLLYDVRIQFTRKLISLFAINKQQKLFYSMSVNQKKIQ